MFPFSTLCVRTNFFQVKKIREINLHYDLFVESLISRKFLEI